MSKVFSSEYFDTVDLAEEEIIARDEIIARAQQVGDIVTFCRRAVEHSKCVEFNRPKAINIGLFVTHAMCITVGWPDRADSHMLYIG